MFESGLRTTSYANRVAQGRLFFVPEIQYPQGFPRFFTQPKST